MAKFKQVPQNYLFHKLLKYWGNMVRNYNEDCRRPIRRRSSTR